MKGGERLIDRQEFECAQRRRPFGDKLIPDLAASELCQGVHIILGTQLPKQLSKLLAVTQ